MPAETIDKIQALVDDLDIQIKKARDNEDSAEALRLTALQVSLSDAIRAYHLRVNYRKTPAAVKESE